MEENKFKFLLPAIMALTIGLIAGYFYGNITGKKTGRTELLTEQKATAEAEAKAAQEEIAKQANPFSATGTEVNPFKGSYQNPFAQ
jgi:uncharacterized protein (UPF0333 family)